MQIANNTHMAMAKRNNNMKTTLTDLYIGMARNFLPCEILEPPIGNS